MVPTARAGGAGRGRYCTSGSRVEGPGGPALPAVPEILPPARATRARNAPAGRTWCSGARRRRRLLPQRGAAGHQHPTAVRSPAVFRGTSCSCAAGATRAPDVTAPAPAPAPPPRPETGSAHAQRRPLARPPRAARWSRTEGVSRVLGWSASGPRGMNEFAPPGSLYHGAGELVRRLHLQNLFYLD